MNILLIGSSGYIGSTLGPYLISKDHSVTGWDLCESDDIDVAFPVEKRDAYEIQSSDLANFEAVLYLGGYSSVSRANQDPAGAIKNNVEVLQRLIDSIGSHRLLYASSGSVYDGTRDARAHESTPLTAARNYYDLTKQFGDQVAGLTNKNVLGLRFGTVNGWSPRTRLDLMLNRMIFDAMEHGVVKLANTHVWRAILAIEDLCEAINLLLLRDAPTRGFLNLCSFNATVEEIGQEVMRQVGAGRHDMSPTPTYDFSMSTERIEHEVSFVATATLSSLVSSIITAYRVVGLDGVAKAAQMRAQSLCSIE